MSDHTILVADDSRTVQTLVRRILVEAGYNVLVATNGVEAVRLAKEHRPHLIVLDIEMPEMDGYGVCDALKQLGAPWENLPIIFLTQVESNALELLGVQLGAYLPKPTNSDRLLETVSRFLPTTMPNEQSLSGV
jgi:CheY-like chemotaxis protein